MKDSRRTFLNRGQAVGENSASSAAFLILIIAILIVVYILFLPAADRDALLSTGTVPGNPPSTIGGYSHLIGAVPLNVNVGQVEYIASANVELLLNSFRVFTQTDASLIEVVNSFFIKNSAFQKRTKEVSFFVDKSNTQQLLLSFNVHRSSGNIIIHFNGEEIFNGELNPGSPVPIQLPQRLVKNENILHFSASTPGFAFWRVNQYDIRNLRITADVTDRTNTANTQKIFIAGSDHEHINTAVLSFFPDCSIQNVETLYIKVNNQELFRGIPDCGLVNHISLGKPYLLEGENTFTFQTDKGSYIIDQPKVVLNLKEPEFPTYYFNLHEDLFMKTTGTEAFCGKIDGVCPSGCESYEDMDCCFEESSQNYWCSTRTTNPRDRCVNQVLAGFVINCPTAYEDRHQNPHPLAEGMCGDDTDGICPSGCSIHYDKDCCFAQSSQHFWCSDVPLTGIANRCLEAVTPSDCESCTVGYRNVQNQLPVCPTPELPSAGEVLGLKSGVNILLQSFFVNDNYKRLDFNINGNTLPIDTYSLQEFRNINIYVREGINSIQIKPRSDVTISQLRVAIQ
jgi:hypothetical protein